MKNRYHRKPVRDPGATEVRKERTCLMCRTAFISAFPGERICPHCKTKSVWREGAGWPPDGRSP